jgi:elongation factor G
LPDSLQDREQQARTEMLESLADFDDALLESLLEDVIPEAAEIYGNLAKDLQEAHIVPVFFGSAENENGVRRLLKALRHEAPEPGATAERAGIEADGEAVVQVFKTMNAAHTGKLSIGRVWHGSVKDGMTLDGSRVSGLFSLMGHKQDKRAAAPVGAVVGMGRMDEVATGSLLTPSATATPPGWPEPLRSLYSLAIHAEQRADEVKLSGALAKLVEEDPSFSFEPNQDTGELLLRGLGEVHLQIAIDRLKNRFNLGVTSSRPQVPYKETIRKSVSQHARHKKQTGGHGQFGDVHVDIKPLPRGSGFTFDNSISGGVVPRQYIPSVENGVKDYLSRGPLGFPVVDVSVTLTDGQYHSVDSSDMAFKSAAQLAMREGMPKCDPVLLEPIFHVDIAVPNEFTSRIQRLVSGRRGQILGFDAKPGWNGWDEVSVQMPQSEMHDLINELRSITLGTGTFEWRFDHLQELTGKMAEQVVVARNADD